jgi:YebC/PmpR family DNA-binding regulatory protein
MTDNRNRTAAAVRHAFVKCGGNLGTDGSVAYMFDRKGQISFAPGVDEDALMEAALEAGADDVQMAEDGSAEVYTSFSDFHAVVEALTAAGFKGDEAEIAMIPSLTAPITELEVAQKVLKLIDMLEDLDDVQNVYHNAEITDELMELLD